MTTDAIGWAIIHSLWQAAALALLLAIALHLMPRVAPAIRYRLTLVALLGSLAWPVITVIARDHVWRADDASVWVRRDGLHAGGAALAPGSVTSSDQPRFAGAADQDGGGTVELLVSLRLRLESLLPLIVTLWAAGLLLFSTRLARGLAIVRRLSHPGSAAIAPPAVVAATAGLARALGVRVTVRVCASASVHGPIVVGYVRPLILLPVSLVTGLPPAQLEALIAHELAHVRRHDLLVNLLQRLIEALMFYHPAVWWISARVRDERESCCDVDAVRACRGDVATYATALLALEEMHDGLVTALAASHGPLLRRIERLVHGRSGRTELGARWSAGILGLITSLLVSDGSIAAREVRPTVPATATDVLPDVREAAAAVPPTVRRRVAPPAVPGASLHKRWQRALDRVSAGHDYWLAWSVAGSADPRYRYYLDDSLAIRIDGDRVRGRAMWRDSAGVTAGIPGDGLESRIGVHRATDLVVLIGVDGAHPGLVTRVHVASATLPAVLGERHMIWLGHSRSGESLTQLRELFTVADRGQQRDLVAAVGMHPDDPGAIATLAAWLADASLSDAAREEAARWLAHHATPAAVVALSRAARHADDRDVREESIEALAELAHPSATDSLLALATMGEDAAVQEMAIEALGERGGSVVAPLLAILHGDRGPRLQAAAAQALGDIGGPVAVIALRQALDVHPVSPVRRRAARAIARATSPEEAIAVLRRAIDADPDIEVRLEAVRSLRRVRGSRGVPALSDLATSHASPEVRRSAVRALGDMRRSDEARAALRTLAKSSDDLTVRSNARAALRDR